ncbi:MAG: YicC/YloC family endoribonuclease [Pseudomonadota bacterium]
MIKSMTGFAAHQGRSMGYRWSWELKGVNGRGLDVRLRLPDWVEGLEAAARKSITACVVRGTITCHLRLTREDEGSTPSLNTTALDAALRALAQIEERSLSAGVALAPSKATDLLAMRGMLDGETSDDSDQSLSRALLTAFQETVSDFNEMRAAEGAALQKLLTAQLEDIASLCQQAAETADTRKDKMAATLRANLAKVLENSEGADEARVAQEIALLAMKADVTEELDRLSAHVNAAQNMLDEGGVVGRKLDFLIQEFNREANTLCAKAQDTALTKVGLALKAVIDQLREQVQNVE